MPVDAKKVDELERQWRDAQNQLLREDGKRYAILKRIVPEEEMNRYLDALENKDEQILFGRALPEEPKRRGRKPGSGVGVATPREDATHECPFCHKTGLTERGLKLHITRMHKEEQPEEEEAA